MKQFALFSAADEGKTPEMVHFARDLITRGFSILASGGTFKYLSNNGIDANNITDIGHIVGEPILNHRVVTLSREIFAGILGDVNSPSDMAEVERLIGGPIKVVYVDLYRLEAAMKEMGGREAKLQDWMSLREKVDIGGPSLLRASGKANGYVLCSQERFGDVLADLDSTATDAGAQTKKKTLKLRLAAEAEAAAQRHSVAAEELYRFMIDQVADEFTESEST